MQALPRPGIVYMLNTSKSNKQVGSVLLQEQPEAPEKPFLLVMLVNKWWTGTRHGTQGICALVWTVILVGTVISTISEYNLNNQRSNPLDRDLDGLNRKAGEWRLRLSEMDF